VLHQDAVAARRSHKGANTMKLLLSAILFFPSMLVRLVGWLLRGMK
jgi:hypothetical protein